MNSENVDRAMEFMLKLKQGLFAEPLTVLARMLDAAEKRGEENTALELMGEKENEKESTFIGLSFRGKSIYHGEE